MDARIAAKLSRELCRKIAPLLADNDPAVQSGALADLTAMWIAGFFVADNVAATEQLRQTLLREHIKLVRHLIPINEQMLLAGLTKH
jgi:hypothetical protein